MSDELKMPEVGDYVRCSGELVSIETEVMRKPRKLLIFHDTTAYYVVKVGEHVLQQGSEYNNFYGRGTCVSEAMKDAKDVLDKYADVDGSYALVYECDDYAIMYDAGGKEKNFYAPEFQKLADFLGGHKLPEAEERLVWDSRERSAL